MAAILEIEKVTKRFGDRTAVDAVSFSVPRASIFGLLGPNGAGKTTTIRMIMRIILPDEGRILFDGQPVDDDRRMSIGYLPEERGLYRKMKVLDHLVFLGTVRGVVPAEARRRALAWLERFGLADRAQSKVETLSKGMQQKVQLIGTLLHRPRLLILDEPFSGLDPLVTREMKDLLQSMRDEGISIVLSTHVLPQVDELCDHICLIDGGRAILAGALETIRQEYGGNVWRTRTTVPEDVVATLPGVLSVTPLGEDLLVELEAGTPGGRLITALVERGEVEAVTRFVPDLENIFIRAVEEGRAHAA